MPAFSAAPTTDGCSTADSTTVPPRRAAPITASALASVPPLVNTICPSPSAATSCARAVFTQAAAATPIRCADEGFPQSSRRQRSTMSATSGAQGVVAALSRYSRTR